MRDRIVWAFTAVVAVAYLVVIVTGIQHHWLYSVALGLVAVWVLGVWLIYRGDERRG